MPKRPSKPIKRGDSEYWKRREEARKKSFLKSWARMKHGLILEEWLNSLAVDLQETRNRVDVLLDQLERKRTPLPGFRIFRKKEIAKLLQKKRAEVVDAVTRLEENIQKSGDFGE